MARAFGQAAVLLGAALLLLSGCSRPAGNPPILIGHVAPWSGPEQASGEHSRQAIRLAVEAINKDPGALGGRPVYVLHPVYPPNDLDTLGPLAVRLIAVDNVLALLAGTHADGVERLGKAAEPYKVPVLSAADFPAEPFLDSVFSVSCGPAFRGEKLAHFAVERLQATRLAILLDGEGAGPAAAVVAGFRKFAAGRKGITIDDWTPRGRQDLAEPVARWKAAQALLYVGPVAGLGKLRSRLQSAGLSLPVLFGGDESFLTNLTTDPEAGQGLYLATAYLAEADDKPNQEFVKRYQERFGAAPDAAAGLAYDSLAITVEALKRPGGTQPDQLLAALAGPKRFSGLTGDLTFGPDHYARRPLFIARLHAGRLHLEQRYDPPREGGPSAGAQSALAKLPPVRYVARKGRKPEEAQSLRGRG